MKSTFFVLSFLVAVVPLASPAAYAYDPTTTTTTYCDPATTTTTTTTSSTTDCAWPTDPPAYAAPTPAYEDDPPTYGTYTDLTPSYGNVSDPPSSSYNETATVIGSYGQGNNTSNTGYEARSGAAEGHAVSGFVSTLSFVVAIVLMAK